ncbi:hypothetical protein THITH_05600 [Thioalkalivibrio paradoxus ARh 1]|uniref:Uncharacterized protein n=1 Tax=Thioalkalivibrio paradoxus ARh 1 TaxID=713585 RepID=W0DSY6_9GAMM|nr:hypothetical protein THITH_05600 [Thioalkalivibrio paradoxus ARh 1]
MVYLKPEDRQEPYALIMGLPGLKAGEDVSAHRCIARTLISRYQ